MVSRMRYMSGNGDRYLIAPPASEAGFTCHRTASVAALVAAHVGLFVLACKCYGHQDVREMVQSLPAYSSHEVQEQFGELESGHAS